MLIGSLETMDKWNKLSSDNVNSMKVEVMTITYLSNTVLVYHFKLIVTSKHLFKSYKCQTLTLSNINKLIMYKAIR